HVDVAADRDGALAGRVGRHVAELLPRARLWVEPLDGLVERVPWQLPAEDIELAADDGAGAPAPRRRQVGEGAPGVGAGVVDLARGDVLSVGAVVAGAAAAGHVDLAVDDAGKRVVPRGGERRVRDRGVAAAGEIEDVVARERDVVRAVEAPAADEVHLAA